MCLKGYLVITYLLMISEFGMEDDFMCNAFHWLYPGGIFIICNELRGKKYVKVWAKHLMKCMDS